MFFCILPNHVKENNLSYGIIFFTFIVLQIKSKKAYLLENMYFIWHSNKICI